MSKINREIDKDDNNVNDIDNFITLNITKIFVEHSACSSLKDI